MKPAEPSAFVVPGVGVVMNCAVFSSMSLAASSGSKRKSAALAWCVRQRMAATLLP